MEMSGWSMRQIHLLNPRDCTIGMSDGFRTLRARLGQSLVLTEPCTWWVSTSVAVGIATACSYPATNSVDTSGLTPGMLATAK